MASRLLTLPPELRLLIYEFTFDTLPIDDDVNLDYNACEIHALHVCSQIRREAIPVFHKRIEVGICAIEDSFEALRKTIASDQEKGVLSFILWEKMNSAFEVERQLLRLKDHLSAAMNFYEMRSHNSIKTTRI